MTASLFGVSSPQQLLILENSRGSECHSGSMLLHPLVHLHVFNGRGELYLQRRPQWKDIQPGCWDTAVGGHADRGERVKEALRREVRQELGIEGLVRMYEFHSERGRELVYVCRTVWDGKFCPSEELDGGRFWTPAQIRGGLGQGISTPNFEGGAGMVATWQ